MWFLSYLSTVSPSGHLRNFHEPVVQRKKIITILWFSYYSLRPFSVSCFPWISRRCKKGALRPMSSPISRFSLRCQPGEQDNCCGDFYYNVSHMGHQQGCLVAFMSLPILNKARQMKSFGVSNATMQFVLIRLTSIASFVDDRRIR
jgi:hypothetical protein